MNELIKLDSSNLDGDLKSSVENITDTRIRRIVNPVDKQEKVNEKHLVGKTTNTKVIFKRPRMRYPGHGSSSKNMKRPAVAPVVSNKPRVSFSCSVCLIGLKSEKELDEHLSSSHPEAKLLSCTLCPYKTPIKNKFLQHQLRHEQTNKFQCEVCGFISVTKTSLRDHLKNHAEEKIYKCFECDYASVRVAHLKRHLKSHSDLVLCCHLCNYGTKIDADLRRHLRLRHGLQLNGHRLEFWSQFEKIEEENKNFEIQLTDITCEVMIEEGTEPLQFDEKEKMLDNKQEGIPLESVDSNKPIKLGPEIEVTVIKKPSKNTITKHFAKEISLH